LDSEAKELIIGWTNVFGGAAVFAALVTVAPHPAILWLVLVLNGFAVLADSFIKWRVPELKEAFNEGKELFSALF
jgi:hypothetical protein